jgi:hypothetical protein
MHHSTTKSALAAIALVFPSALGGVISRRMNPNENVLLTYCRDNSNNIVNGQMAYFSGTPNGMPDATTIVSGPTGPTFGQVPPGVVIWESTTTNVGTFSDGNTFSSLIRFQPDDGTYAGLGQNHEGYFSCYRHDTYSAYYYTDSAGLTCTEEYICNHNSPTTTPVFTNFAPSAGTVTLENTIQWTAGHVIAMAANTFQNGICQPGNSQTIDDNGCTISFTCNSNGNTELQDMTNFLVNDVAQAPNSNFQTLSEVDNPQNGPCQSPIACPSNPPPHQYYLTMPMELSMNIDYLETPFQPDGLSAASFSYSITCPAQGCFACQTLEAFLTGAALVPDLATIAAVANIGATAACQQTMGC